MFQQKRNLIPRGASAVEQMEFRLLLATAFVDAGAPGSIHNGLGWSSAYTDLQQALAVASPGDVIKVADGVYTPTNTTDITSTFQLKSGVSLLGGYAGYGAATRGRIGASMLINNALKRHFTHAIVMNDVPGAHARDVAFSYGGDLIPDPDIDRRGFYLWTARLHNGAGAMGVSDQDYGGTACAHELMHLMIHPGAAAGWAGEHETNNAGGTALMGDPAPLACTEAGVRITALNTGEIDVAGNPNLWP
jgi:hypothetical protein